MTDLPSRIEIVRLRTIVQGLAMSLSSLTANVAQLRSSGVGVFGTIAELSTTNAASYSVVLLKRDDAGQFGIFFPETTSTPVDNRSVIADVTGRTFVRFE